MLYKKVILTEAPSDKPIDLPDKKNKQSNNKDNKDPLDKTNGSDDETTLDPPPDSLDNTPPDNENTDGSNDPSVDASDDLSDTTVASNTEAIDPVVDKLRRERLFDAILDIQVQGKTLANSLEILLERIKDETALKFITQSKNILDIAIKQCDTLQTRFSDIAYEKIREIYATIRERVSAVAEIIEHVIDKDEDFRSVNTSKETK
jgi:hypothetical protein